jgi:hypothetical protein
MNTSQKAIQSFIIKGDVSMLSQEERVAHYLETCARLGIDPNTLPLQYIKFQGREICYLTRVATDQLAEKHQLDREIIDGPKVIDAEGTKMIFACCRAKLPSGRVETAVATVPLNDPLNGFMKCETKAKRRATLSILGLGMLDESEIETIPGIQSAERVSIPANQTKLVSVPSTQNAAAAGDIKKVAAINVANETQLLDRANAVATYSDEVRNAYAVRWAALVKTEAGRAAWRKMKPGALRDEVLFKFDELGVESRDYSEEVA